MRSRTSAVVGAAIFVVGAALTGPATSAATPAPGPKATAPASETQRVPPVIRGKVGPRFTISVSQHRADPRRYRIVVRDRSSQHNWHIRGPGVNRKTRVAFVGRKVWRVRFQTGTYRIVCDPHSSTMRTRIVVS